MSSRPALNIVVAVELWSPGFVPAYAPMAAAWPLPGVDDPHSRSWSEYGVRTGGWRLLDLLAAHELPATVGISGAVAQRFPDVVRAVQAGGHEIAAHSWTQNVIPAALDVEDEERNLVRCTTALGELTGVTPTGWMSPRASASPHTAELLARHGYRWTGDHADRDRTDVIGTASGPLVRMMHSDYSDVRDGGNPRAYLDLHRDLVDALLAGPSDAVGTLALHAHVGGRPLLAGYVDRLLAYVAQRRDELRITTRGELADALLAEGTTV